ncbi:MAG TPA: hypothetical protein PLW34_06560 [Termitinemataceae bacterium]|jgi:hypothetical protein|nr:hypothetical protein [Treponema sp. J25]HOJ99203.1 hypothetical protein [Termitinemataceae bacterium]HOM23911.1 hypothetical protein [Termitinemataceae bacterium]HPQ00984.1 hypothetical protein [Termitinemataceae bacterium]
MHYPETRKQRPEDQELRTELALLAEGRGLLFRGGAEVVAS